MEVEMYVLGLPNFRDDSVVFGTDELKSIKREISKYLRRKGLLDKESEAPGGWHVFKLSPERLYTKKPQNSDESYFKESSNYSIHVAELGYYHHRVIMYLKLSLVDFYISKKNEVKLRWLVYSMIENPAYFTPEEIQKILKKPIGNIIDEYLGERIEEIKSFEKGIRDEQVEDYITKEVRNELKNLTNDIINGYIRKRLNKFKFLERKIEINRKVKSCIQEEFKGLKDSKTIFKNIDEIEELKSDLTEIEELKSDLTEIEELKNELVELIDNTIDEVKEELEKMEELVDNIINELQKEKTQKIKSAKRNKSKEEIKSCIHIRLKELEELKNELRNTDKLKYLKKSEELIDTLIDELLEEKTDKFKSAIGNKVNEETRVCIQTEMEKNITELDKELKEFCRFRNELKELIKLRNRLRESINAIVCDYKEKQRRRFYTLEKIRKKMKKLEVYMIDISSEDFEEEKDKFLALRDARKALEKGTRNLINDCVIENVNELIPSKKVTEKGKIEFIYTYPLIVVKSSAEKHEPVPFSEETTSLCFEIAEPKWWPLSGRKHMMRISIPSTILYVQKGIGKNLLRDIINAIYQYCLYEKKAKDEKKRLIDWKNGPYDNQLDEDILTKLWEHVLHAMGGRSTDLRVVRITNMTRLIALLAFLVSASSLILTLILRYLSQSGN